MKLKLSKDDLRILKAAVSVALENDSEGWDELSGDEIDRAYELLDELEVALDGSDDDDDDEPVSDGDDEDDEDGDVWGDNRGYNSRDDDDES